MGMANLPQTAEGSREPEPANKIDIMRDTKGWRNSRPKGVSHNDAFIFRHKNGALPRPLGFLQA